MQYVETVEVPIDDPQDYPGNARVHDDDWLDESAETNGQYRAVLARRLDDGTLQLLAGHGTRAAFRRRGDTKIRVEVIEADDREARRINLVDNPRPGIGGFDDSALLALLDSASVDGGLTGTGWDADAYEELLDKVGRDMNENPHDWRPDVDPDEQDVEPPAEPVTKPGDLWILGDHRLACGDSTHAVVWDALMQGGKANCIWTDPPYGVAIVGGNHALSPEERLARGGKTIQNDALDEAGLDRLIRAALGAALGACREGGAWYVAAPPGPLNLIFGSYLNEIGVYRQQIIWVKDSFVMGRSDYHYRHEPIFYGWKPGAAHHPVPDRTQDSVWEIPRPKRSEDHPTMKPVDLVVRALNNSTNAGDVVADPFAGSGTTIVACQMTGRSGRGIELDPRYCDVIARRYQGLTGEYPVLEATGEAWDFTATPPCPVPV